MSNNRLRVTVQLYLTWDNITARKNTHPTSLDVVLKGRLKVLYQTEKENETEYRTTKLKMCYANY